MAPAGARHVSPRSGLAAGSLEALEAQAASATPPCRAGAAGLPQASWRRCAAPHRPHRPCCHGHGPLLLEGKLGARLELRRAVCWFERPLLGHRVVGATAKSRSSASMLQKPATPHCPLPANQHYSPLGLNPALGAPRRSRRSELPPHARAEPALRSTPPSHGRQRVAPDRKASSRPRGTGSSERLSKLGTALSRTRSGMTEHDDARPCPDSNAVEVLPAAAAPEHLLITSAKRKRGEGLENAAGASPKRPACWITRSGPHGRERPAVR